ncbi:unnamed protein product [Rotaria sp. Silwood1]|nr:unnamed protein product [Rotaria sp. Silwood1]
MDSSKGNLLTSTSLNDGHKTSVSSLANTSTIDNNNTNEHTTMSLNRRDGPLAQKLASKLSIVANTNVSISSTNNHNHYKSSPNGNHDVEEQEQLSPLAGTWGFLPSPTENDESSSILSHSQTRSSESNSPHKSSSQKKV